MPQGTPACTQPPVPTNTLRHVPPQPQLGHRWDVNRMEVGAPLPQLRLSLDGGDKVVDALAAVGHKAEEGDSRWRLSLASILQRIWEDVRVEVRVAREDHDRDVMRAGRLDSHATTAILVLKDDEI